MLFRGRGRFVVLWLGPALEGLEAAAGPGFQRGEERIRTDRPADALASAQARRRPFVLVGRSAKREKRWRAGARSVRPSSARPKSARARPRPVFGPLDETGAHGIEVHVAVGGGEMVLVHRHGAVSSLPEMAGSPPPRVDQSGISTMHARQGAA